MTEVKLAGLRGQRSTVQVRQKNCLLAAMDIHLQKLLGLHGAVSGLGDFFTLLRSTCFCTRICGMLIPGSVQKNDPKCKKTHGGQASRGTSGFTQNHRLV